MTEPKTIQDYQKAIDEKTIELLKKQAELSQFVGTEHHSSAAKAYQKAISDLMVDINQFLIEITESKKGLGEDKVLAHELFNNAFKLHEIIMDMSNVVSSDLSNRNKDEEIDYSKAAALVAALAVTVVTLSKHIFGQTTNHPAIEAGIGAAVGMLVSFHKPIRNLMKMAHKSICKKTAANQNRLTFSKAHEVSKKVLSAIAKPVRNEKSFLICHPKQQVARQGLS